MIDQNTALWVYSIVATAFIFWISVPPLIRPKDDIVSVVSNFLADYEKDKPNFSGLKKDAFLVESEAYEKRFSDRFQREIRPLIHKSGLKIQDYKVSQRRWQEVLEEIENQTRNS